MFRLVDFLTIVVTPQSFGGQLRKLREQRRVTLEVVEKRTKVSIGLLRSLEKGGCEGWPGGIYSRGYIRAYAEAIGVDPEHVLAAFVECYPVFAPAPVVEPVPEAAEPPRALFGRLKAVVAGWFLAAAAAPAERDQLARSAEHRLADQRHWQRTQADVRVVGMTANAVPRPSLGSRRGA